MNEDLEFMESEFLADQEDLETIFYLENLDSEEETEKKQEKERMIVIRSKLQDARILAKKFMRILAIDKKLQIVLGEKEFTEARVIQHGRLILENKEKEAILKNEYDTIRIVLHGEIPLLTRLPKWLQKQQFIETIFHELLHIKHPHWNEEKIRDFSAEFIGKLLTSMEKHKEK